MRRRLAGRLRTAAGALHDALEEIDARHMLIGGVAVIARGVPRFTNDVDATVRADGPPLDEVLRALARHALKPRAAGAREFARRSQMLLLRHRPTKVDVDLSLAWLPFEHDAIDRAEPLRLGGVTIPVARPEDLIVYKVVAWRLLDRDDVEKLLLRHGRRMDLGRVRRLVVEFAAILETPERVAEFDQLVSSALPGRTGVRRKPKRPRRRSEKARSRRERS